MAKNKVNPANDYPGVWIQVKLPSELQTDIKIEALRDRVTIKEKIVELLQFGYDSKYKSTK